LAFRDFGLEWGGCSTLSPVGLHPNLLYLRRGISAKKRRKEEKNINKAARGKGQRGNEEEEGKWEWGESESESERVRGGCEGREGGERKEGM
jgi:hypothetical protein